MHSKNNVSDHIIDRTDMTASLVKTAQGETIMEQTLPRVAPITMHPEREICEASLKLINLDSTRFSTARILMQVHMQAMHRFQGIYVYRFKKFAI